MGALINLISIILCIKTLNAGCPFAAMMNSYNFSGDWSYNVTMSDDSDSEVYVMHICHFENNEIYFSLGLNTSEMRIGFGSGNWSQSNQMIGGLVFEINNGSTESHGFAIGMNMKEHKWWIQDKFKSQPLLEGQKGLDIDKCVIPYGINIRREYFQSFWDAKRKFHRQQRIEKRRRDRERKKRLRLEKKKPIYTKYYEKFLDFVGFSQKEENNTESNAIINAKFVYDQKPNFPSLFGTSWISNNNELNVTFMNHKNACFNGQLLSNISIAYYGIAINSFIQTDNGIRNGQYFVQTQENKLIGSYIIFKLNNDGKIVHDKIKQFTMQKTEFVPCLNTKIANINKCDSTINQKCEL